MRKLLFLTAAVMFGITYASAAKPKVALYLDHGCRGAGDICWAVLLSSAPEFDFAAVNAADVKGGRLADFDCLVMPGGGGHERYADWGEEGCAKIREFVHAGGRYLGTCAGCSVLLNEKGRVRLIPYKGDGSWGRGGMTATLRFDPRFAELTGVTDERRGVRYHDGPCPVPADPIPGVTAEILATYDCTLMEKGEQPSPMNGKPAAIWAEYGQGRVLAYTVHPEVAPANYDLIQGAFKALLGVSPTFPVKKRAARPLRALFYSNEIDEGPDTREIVASAVRLAQRPDVDLIPTTFADLAAGALDHADVLVLPAGRHRKIKPRVWALVESFKANGGRVLTSADKLEE